MVKIDRAVLKAQIAPFEPNAANGTAFYKL
jgi:hypothetical protein